MREIKLLRTPFPHVIGTNFFNDEQLSEIWEELKFLSKPNKLFLPGVHHGAMGFGGLTESRALCLEEAYRIRELSNILKIYKTILKEPEILRTTQEWPSYLRLSYIQRVITKVRYYHNGEKYGNHCDWRNDFLLFSYFHTEPKKFSGGEVYFREYDYTFECNHNTLIILPGYIQHEVKEVSLLNDDYWNGNGRYCISQFLSIEPKIKNGYIKNA